MEPIETDIYEIDPAWGADELAAAESDLQSRLIAVAEDIARIRAQIDREKADYEETGERPRGRQWQVSAETALRHRGRQHQAYSQALAQVKRRIRALRHAASERDDGRAFISAAKSLLPPATYESIWAEVRRRRMGEG